MQNACFVLHLHFNHMNWVRFPTMPLQIPMIHYFPFTLLYDFVLLHDVHDIYFRMKASSNLLQLCVCVLLHTVSSVPNLQTEWNEWKQKYEKSYFTSEDENLHFEIWNNNYNYVRKHNTKTDNGFQLDLNQFADQVFKSVLYCQLKFSLTV